MLRSPGDDQHNKLFDSNDHQHDYYAGVYGLADYRRSADYHHNAAPDDHDHNADNHYAGIDPNQHDGDNHHGDDNSPTNNHAGVNPQHNDHGRSNNNYQAPDHDDNAANDLHSAEHASDYD